jgi:hypothetical protein
MCAIAMLDSFVRRRESSNNTYRILVSHYRNSAPIRLKVVQFDVIMTYEATQLFVCVWRSTLLSRVNGRIIKGNSSPTKPAQGVEWLGWLQTCETFFNVLISYFPCICLHWNSVSYRSRLFMYVGVCVCVCVFGVRYLKFNTSMERPFQKLNKITYNRVSNQ